MIKKNKTLIVTYFNQVEAIATEKVCNTNGLGGRLITTPRYIEAGCGMSFSISTDKRKQLEELLKSEKIKYDKIIELEI